MNTPRPEKKEFVSTHHGITKTESYHWLRAENWQEVMHDPSVLDAEIRSYLEAENAYTQHMMADTEALQETLFEEMKGRIKQDDSSVPSPDGPFAYALKYVQGGQHPIFYRVAREGQQAQEEILLDGDKEAEGQAYFKIAGASHCDDHSKLAWAYDDKGSEYFTLKIRDLASGTDLDEIISNTAGGGVWSADSKFVFYVEMDANHRPSKLFRHQVGTPQSEDTLVYEEKDAGFFMSVGRTQSGRFITIDIHDHETAEVWLIPADDPSAAPKLVAPRETGIEYSVEDHGDKLIILTNAGDAEDFKIVTTDLETQLANPGQSTWTDLVAHEAGRLILSFNVLKEHMIRLERFEGLPRIMVHRLEDGEEHSISFDEEAYSLGFSAGYEFDTTLIRFTYSSMTTPSRVFDYDVASRERVMRKEQEVPSGHTPSDYVTRRLQAVAPDGVKVPVTVLYRADTPLDGSAPCLLYGYGSYGISIPASFNTNALSLVDRGFVYAIAHIRGGKDKGFGWYKAGRREFKKNTFTDFIAASSHLVQENFTAHDRIVAQGGSAGGMLMGAVANMAPQNFKGIIAEVPFVDVLATMLDDTLPLTPPEWPEWGNPITDETAYNYIASYSPIDNVEAKAYPAIFALGGLTDPRVTYWEPAKWVATLREKKTDDNLLMLRTNMDAGHGGASGRFDRLKEVALVYSFALKTTGKIA
ncbi:S9 family peptidase [Pseudovibrio exalbescens]|uniref:S9 family peptidase n=1 Tax=Pseudovibrio exalbescens TaxID=197461 RepID=UPI002366713C|nr:S9 family peptidase [Pseudovibrio exalbescens]MDD7909176.1 S9 family peptidase [Pseudovibrio exalbescens]